MKIIDLTPVCLYLCLWWVTCISSDIFIGGVMTNSATATNCGSLFATVCGVEWNINAAANTPKMVQLCIRILYARKPTYKILKPV